ncbi:MAG: glycosyl transferase [Nitrospirota bacterium]
MSDFYQTGVVATFHRLGASKLERIESELKWYSQERPVALVLPSLYSELQGEALKGIVTRLKEVEYVKQVIVALGPASEEEFKHARDFFSGLPQSTRVIWNHGPRLTEIYRALEAADLPPGEEGKGKSAWMAYGYVLSQMDLRVIALHDCDILTYGREMLARLCYPVVNPNLDYDFCKGFYSRVTDRMHGRVTRLLVTPLLRAISAIIGEQPLVQFFDSFRYPLAGEFSIDVDLSRVIRIPGDWGLEMGVLAEVYRNTSVRRVCQIGFFKTLLATYVRIAQDFLKRYEDDAAVNGLAFDRHNESLAVETFTSGIEKAAQIIMDNPVGVPLIPPWERVTSALPNILRHIRAAVDDDNA